MYNAYIWMTPFDGVLFICLSVTCAMQVMSGSQRAKLFLENVLFL